MSLVRFDGSSDRGPSPGASHGIVDWVAGSLKTYGGVVDFDDYVPHNTAVYLPDPTTSEVTTKSTERYGVINVFEAAGSNETAGIQRQVYHDLNLQPIFYFGARVKFISDADSPQMFLGLSDTAVTAVWSAGALAVSSNQDMIGFRWNADETVDFVVNLDGTLTVVVDDIGTDIVRTDGFAKFEFRVEEMTPTQYRVTSFLNGAKMTAGTFNRASTSMPLVPMRPVIAATVAATTDVSFDVDWTMSADK